MSFESPSGAPAPEDAAPLTPPYQGAPPFQGTPQFGAAPHPPNAGPYGIPGYQGAPPAAQSNAALPIALIALCGLYVVICLVEIFALNNRVSLANRLINDPTSVTIDQAHSADNLVSGLSVAALVVFLGVIVVLSVWQRSLRKALAVTGRYQQVLKASGYQIFRIIWLVSILLAVVLRGSGNLDTPQDVVSHDHQYMLYYGVRAALAVFLTVLAVRLKRNADSAFARPLTY